MRRNDSSTCCPRESSASSSGLMLSLVITVPHLMDSLTNASQPIFPDSTRSMRAGCDPTLK